MVDLFEFKGIIVHKMLELFVISLNSNMLATDAIINSKEYESLFVEIKSLVQFYIYTNCLLQL